MRAKVSWSYVDKEMDLAAFVSSELENNNVSGQIEQIEETVNNISATFGRLIDVLTEKELLSKSDIKRILKTHAEITHIFTD